MNVRLCDRQHVGLGGILCGSSVTCANLYMYACKLFCV